MKIENLNDWITENFSYDLISELVVLSEVERITFNSDTREKAKAIKSRLLDSNRPNGDKVEVKKYYYIKRYLNNFLCDRPDNFDRLLKLVNEKDVILVEHLKELNGTM